MLKTAGRLAVILVAPLLLASCLLAPGRFVSTLDIKRDRSFSFAYSGEVVVIDFGEGMKLSSTADEEGGSTEGDTKAASPADPKVETAKQLSERRAMAEALSKEVGYRSAEYLGQGKFRVDYALSGKLDRNFVYPFNTDAAAIFPWIAIELRKDGSARIKAPAFGEDNNPASEAAGPVNPMDDAAKSREGTFTLTTDAQLVMQNNEEGLAPGPGTKVIWTVTPTSKTVPTAVLRFPS